MHELDDNALLRKYVESDSEEAFAALVTRHVDKVYSVALRLTRNPHQAEEIAQAVFVMLAQKSHKFSRKVVLSGWLYQTARLTAITFVRSEIRRARREQEAHMQTPQNESESDLWMQIAPLLDAAMAALSETDRHAIVLRFFDGKSMKEVGFVLGASEDAVKMRVSRAVEKLRSFLSRRGVVVHSTALTTAISAHSVQAAPVNLAATISSTAVAAKSTLAAASGAAIKTIAMTTLQKTLITAVVAAAVGVAIYEARQTANLRAQIQALQRERNSALRQLASVSTKSASPRLPAPPIQIIVQTNAAPVVDEPPLTNLYARLKDKSKVLTPEQIAAYLQANRTNAATLLAAYRTGHDIALLREAMEKYPKDPHVAFEAAFAAELSPEERQQWISTFEQDAPDNALPFYLAAQKDFAAGQSDKALQELAAAAGKPLDDYTTDRMAENEAAYLAAGYSPAEAKTIAQGDLLLQQLGPMKQLGQSLVWLANSYNQSGDSASAQSALQMAMNLGQNIGGTSDDPTLITQLVSAAVENMVLTNMDPNSPYAGNGQTVQDRLNQIAQNRVAIKQLVQQANALFPTLSDQDWMTYETRAALFGGAPALQWLVNKYGPPAQ